MATAFKYNILLPYFFLLLAAIESIDLCRIVSCFLLSVSRLVFFLSVSLFLFIYLISVPSANYAISLSAAFLFFLRLEKVSRYNVDVIQK